MALKQCNLFFERHPRIKPVVADDTAGSVAEVVKQNDPKLAAIAGRHAAELYGGEIILENIQDDPKNHTRFVLLSAKEHES
jgi:prephenate dehydratase